VRRTILTLAAVLAATAAHAQNTVYPHKLMPPDPEAGLPLYKMTKMPPPDPIGDVPPGWQLAALMQPPVERVVMNGGKGGSISEHQAKFWALKQQGATVEMHAGCWSACTLITAFIPKERLCFAEGSFMAFHSARTVQSPAPKIEATLAMYRSYPVEIQHWIDRNGGPYKMTVETYWTLYAPDLWAMGYPRCK
jgi:hypothetical protein